LLEHLSLLLIHDDAVALLVGVLLALVALVCGLDLAAIVYLILKAEILKGGHVLCVAAEVAWTS